MGGDFHVLLDKVGRLDEDQARFYIGELVLAIDSLHVLGVVHRDLKPDNILMDAKGHLRLSDFGLSQNAVSKYKNLVSPKKTSVGSLKDLLDDGFRLDAAEPPVKKSPMLKRANTSVTVSELEKNGKERIFKCLDHEGGSFYSKTINENQPQRGHPKLFEEKVPSIVGTPDYMAPEIIDSDRYNRKTYNEKCMDWWSLGVMLYQFLVGIPPFCSETLDEVFDNILKGRIEWPPIGKYLKKHSV